MAEAQEVEKFKFPDENTGGEEVKPEEKLDISVEGEDDVNIEVVDDTPEADRGHKPGSSKDIQDVSEEELAAYSGNVQKRIKELSFARHDERRAKETAMRERQELERVAQGALDENRRLKEYVQVGEKAYQGTAKAAAAAKLEMAKQHYKDAHEAFDAEAQLAAVQELTAAQLELTAAENFRPVSLTPQQERAYTPPTEQGQPDDRAVRWQQRNRWFGADDEMTALALATHKRLVESGVDPRSDDYYKRIDTRIRQLFPESSGGENPSSPTAHRKPANVVAPTARSSSAKKVTLTQTQVNLAKKFGITLEDYAKQVVLQEINNGR